MDYKVVSNIEKEINKLEFKNYSVNIEMKDGSKVNLSKEENKKDTTIGFTYNN